MRRYAHLGYILKEISSTGKYPCGSEGRRVDGSGPRRVLRTVSRATFAKAALPVFDASRRLVTLPSGRIRNETVAVPEIKSLARAETRCNHMLFIR